jgi:LPS sulfotransferase NodH
LQAAGDVGCPTESFNPRGFIPEEKARRQVESFADYIRSLNDQPGQAFVFKTCWHDWAPVADGLKLLFPRLQLVYLDRRDVIAQAVSLFRAEITNHWARRPGEKLPQAEALDDKFNLQRIEHIIENLVSEKTQWELYFKAQGRTPARLFYESFVHDTGHALRFFAQHTGLALKPEIAPDAGYEKLADRLSDAWVDRMRRHVLQMT